MIFLALMPLFVGVFQLHHPAADRAGGTVAVPRLNAFSYGVPVRRLLLNANCVAGTLFHAGC